MKLRVAIVLDIGRANTRIGHNGGSATGLYGRGIVTVPTTIVGKSVIGAKLMAHFVGNKIDGIFIAHRCGQTGFATGFHTITANHAQAG